MYKGRGGEKKKKEKMEKVSSRFARFCDFTRYLGRNFPWVSLRRINKGREKIKIIDENLLLLRYLFITAKPILFVKINIIFTFRDES